MADTLPTDVADLIPIVATGIRGTVLGRENTGGTRVTDIAEVAVCACHDYAPAAPLSAKREASLRYAGWIFGNRPHARGIKIASPDGTSLETDFGAAATMNGLRASGATAMLSRYVQRRAGVIG